MKKWCMYCTHYHNDDFCDEHNYWIEPDDYCDEWEGGIE